MEESWRFSIPHRKWWLILGVAAALAALGFLAASIVGAQEKEIGENRPITLVISDSAGLKEIVLNSGCHMIGEYTTCLGDDGVHRLRQVVSAPFSVERALDWTGKEIQPHLITVEELRGLGVDLSNQDATPRDSSHLPVYAPHLDLGIPPDLSPNLPPVEVTE